jgi:hypothetical protein
MYLYQIIKVILLGVFYEVKKIALCEYRVRQSVRDLVLAAKPWNAAHVLYEKLLRIAKFRENRRCSDSHNLSADNTQLYILYKILYSTAVLFCVKIGFALTSKLSCVYS